MAIRVSDAGRRVVSNREFRPGRRGARAARTALTAAALCAAASAVTPAAHAATKTWIGTTGNWSTAGNWSAAGQPANNDTVLLTQATAVEKIITFDNAATATTLVAVTIDATGEGTMTLQFAAGSTKTLSILGTETIGNDGIGTLAQLGATHTVTTLMLGNNLGSSGNYNLGGGTLNASDATIGRLGSGIFTQNGGTANFNGAAAANDLVIGGDVGSSGTYILNAGNVNVTAGGGAVIGDLGGGGMQQSAGTVTIGTGGANKNLFMGRGVGGFGSYQLNGGTLTVNGNAFIGGSAVAGGGSGWLQVTGGTAVVTGTLKAWNTDGSLGVQLSAGSLTAAAIDTNGNPDLFAWTGGALNITGAGGFTVGAAGALGDDVFLGGGQVLNVTTTTTIAPGSDLTIDGGSLTTASLTGAGVIDFENGTINVTSGGLTVAAGQPLGASAFVGGGSSITASGPFANNAVLDLNGGTIGGGSAFTNTGNFGGFGTVTGAGNITNSGVISVWAGPMILAKTGTVTNNNGATIEVETGRELRLGGGNLNNSGWIKLNGSASLTTTSGAQVINNAGGMISGSGTIFTGVTNNGAIAVKDPLSVIAPVTNSGTITLDSISAQFSVGGAGLSNTATGVIQGNGVVTGGFNNAGRIEAVGGALTIAGINNNLATGTMVSGAGTSLLVTGAVGTNLGTINVTGGAFDTNGQPFSNAGTGVMNVRGTLRTGGLTNGARLEFTGGNSDVHGAVTGGNLSQTILSGSANAFFHNNLTLNTGSQLQVNAGSSLIMTGAAALAQTGGTVTNHGVIQTGAGGYVMTGGTLLGSGTISGPLTSTGGTIAPGASVGTLTVNALTLNTGSVLNYELAAAPAGDRINVANDFGLNLAGSTTLNITNVGGFGTGTYTLIDYSNAFAGALGNLTLGTRPAGFVYTLQNNPLNTSIELLVGLPGSPGVWLGGTGNWSEAAKWEQSAIPNDASVHAQIDNGNGTVSNVTLNQNATVGRVTLNAADSLTVAATRTLAIAGTGASALSGNVNNAGAVNIQANTASFSGGGTHTGAFSVAAGATLAFAGGTHNLNAGSTLTGAGTVAVTGGAVNIAAAGTQTFGALQLSSGADVSLAAGAAKAIKVSSLSIDAPSGSRLDLNAHKLIVAGGDLGTVVGGSYNGLSGLVDSAHNGGAWNGNGITTTHPQAASGLTSLGIATANQLGRVGSSFGGTTLASGDVMVMLTYAGDANLDGFISGDDYTRIDFNIGTPGAIGWVNGDFNYDGLISGDDYTIIDFNIVAQGAAFPTGGAAAAGLSGVTAVPEPGAIGVLGLAAAGLSARRQRRL